MQAIIVPSSETPRISNAHSKLSFPPLEQVTRSVLTTDETAFYLNRRPQTLRLWACYENGPLHPIRINGRLGWSVGDVKRLLAGGQ